MCATDQDQLQLRGEEWVTARDNVLFELGLAIGKLGPNRAFFVKPRVGADRVRAGCGRRSPFSAGSQ
ncbi:nucleotide-binding protein [Brevibacillus composti]|uniref:Nucleotide-binding protein n=1 Tax=Brevibacillus composti TaxID=2796470 RepID=A0A7T5JN99_9BACL|nr:nucleotide-binding protein [Brevibacillus composti]QUO40976.1 nucleotide-binding protein [Brevibacillus composti]